MFGDEEDEQEIDEEISDEEDEEDSEGVIVSKGGLERSASKAKLDGAVRLILHPHFKTSTESFLFQKCAKAKSGEKIIIFPVDINVTVILRFEV